MSDNKEKMVTIGAVISEQLLHDCKRISAKRILERREYAISALVREGLSLLVSLEAELEQEKSDKNGRPTA